MSDFNKQIKKIKKARAAAEKAENALYLKKLSATKNKKTELLSEIERDIRVENTSLLNSKEALQRAITEFYRKSQQELVGELNSDYPILFFPLRLETRFMKNDSELWLRIYPDDIHIHSHESYLTEQEKEKGMRYWKELVRANRLQESTNLTLEEEKLDIKKAAWVELTKEGGNQRALWIAKQTKPLNWRPEFNSTVAALNFPVLEDTKSHSWTRAPRTDILPNRFVVSIHKGERIMHVQEGNLVPDRVFTGADPLQAEEAFNKDEEAETIHLGKDFAWITDFSKAEKMGLGIRIELKNRMLNRGKVDKISVLGVLASADPEEGEKLMETLIESHHYSHKGFSFLPQGTATNNTGEKDSDYEKNENQLEKGYYDGLDLTDFNSEKETEGEIFARTLGINKEVLKDIKNAGMKEGHHARAMNTALYPATIGSFFESFLKPVIDPQYYDALRKFFIENVSTKGLLPAFRVGDQPYGILVTSDLSNWKEQREQSIASAPKFPMQLSSVLNKLQKKWEILAQKVAHVGKGGNPDEILLQILGLDAGSANLTTRMGLSPGLVHSLSNIPSDYRDELEDLQSSILSFLKELGYNPQRNTTVNPRISGMQFKEHERELPRNNYIEKGRKPKRNTPLSKIGNTGLNYIQWLAKVTSVEALETHQANGSRLPNTLLYLLLHYALLQELNKGIEKEYKKFDVPVFRDSYNKTHINFSKQTADLTFWETAKGKPSILGIQGLKIEKPMADYLLEIDSPTNKNLKEVQKSLAILGDLSTDELENHLLNHIDLCSYRLDAWQNGMINKRLKDRRKKQVKGLYLGAYGWLTDILPEKKIEKDVDLIPKKLRPKNNRTVFKPKENAGFLHTPSLNHATAAGVMMAGYRNNADRSNPDAFAVNLSSDRVRRAQNILDGVHNGQSLEELLGYQFERGIHDITSSGQANLNKYILEFRDAFQIEATIIGQQGRTQAPEVFAVPIVVNGIALAEAKKDTIEAIVNQDDNATNTKNRKLILKEVDRLKDTIDAVNDLLTAESAYQATQGNFDRASGVLNSLRYAQRPPETQVDKTPRSRLLTYTNRISIHLDEDSANIAGGNWTTVPSPRSIAEPGLNKWLGQILGNPRKIFFEVAEKNEEDVLIQPTMYALSKLRLQPIDLIYIVGADYEGGATELESRIGTMYRTNLDIEENAAVSITFKPIINRNTGISFARIFPLIRYLKLLLTSSKAAQATDFMPISEDLAVASANKEGWNLEKTKSRVLQILEMLKALQLELSSNAPNSIAEKTPDNPASFTDLFRLFYEEGENPDKWKLLPSLTEEGKEILIEYQEALASFGFSTAYPDNRNFISETSEADLLAKTAGLWRQAEQKISRAAEYIQKSEEETGMHKKCLHLQASIHAIFGEEFLVLPSFGYMNQTDLKKSFKEKGEQLLKHIKQVQGGDNETVMETWCQSLAPVRPNIALWEKINLLNEAFNEESALLQPVQVPYRAKDSWLAVEFPKKREDSGEPFDIEKNTLSIATHGASAAKTAKLQCAFIVDEWTETIPTDEEITGITFNYNQPNATASNTLLLAVEPGISKKWTWETIENIMEDTQRRMRTRAVEPAHLKEDPVFNALLPMTIATFDLNNSSPSLDFLTADSAFMKKASIDLSMPLYLPFLDD